MQMLILMQQRQIRLIECRQCQLSDFYKPSDEMKEYQYLTTGIIRASAGYTLFKFLKDIVQYIIINTALYCNDCRVRRIVVKGYYTCPKCGVISDNYLTNGGEWIENIFGQV